MCQDWLWGVLTQPKGVVTDVALAEAGGISWRKSTTSGPIWPWITLIESHGFTQLREALSRQAQALSRQLIVVVSSLFYPKVVLCFNIITWNLKKMNKSNGSASCFL